MTDPVDYEIIAGIGNEVFYFFVVVLLVAVVAAAWYSTQVVEPVVQSVILVERTAVPGAAARPSSPEDVRAAVSQFLQQQPEEEEAEQEVGQQEEESLERAPEVQEELPEEERVTIRLKFLNETQKDVEASLVESLGQFKRRNFTEEIGDNKNVRLIFNGQVLRDEGGSLRSCGLFDKCVVHCLVSTLPAPTPARAAPAAHGHSHAHAHQAHQQQGHQVDVSAFFIPVLGVALAMVWYLALVYSSYFNVMSTTALLGLTSLYLLSVYGTHFHVNVAVRTGGGPAQAQR